MGNAIDTIPVGLGEGEWKKVKFVDQGQITTFRCKESDKHFMISRVLTKCLSYLSLQRNQPVFQ